MIFSAKGSTEIAMRTAATENAISYGAADASGTSASRDPLMFSNTRFSVFHVSTARRMDSAPVSVTLSGATDVGPT